MIAVLIILAAIVLGVIYGRCILRMSGEALMTLGPLVLVPWVVIVIAAIAALLVLT